MCQCFSWWIHFFFPTWISTLSSIQDWPSHVDISNRVTRRDVSRTLCRCRNVAKMNSGCNFQNYSYRHSEFGISLQAKAPSETSLKCVISFFSLRLWPGGHTIREVIVWCSTLPMHIACDHPQLLWFFAVTLCLARYLTSRVPQLPCHTMLSFCQPWGKVVGTGLKKLISWQ